MNYKIKREISPDELYHAKEGEEREDHKYIARVLLKKVNVGGKKKNRYRYFYDKKSYQAYLNSKKSKELKPKSSEGNLLEKIKGSTEKGQNLISSFLKKNTSKKVEELGSSYDSNKGLKDAVSFLIGGVIGYTVKEFLRKKAEEPVVVTNNFRFGPEEEKEEPKPEYKTQLPNGKYKYFDSKDEFEAYKKRENDENEAYHERLEYQQNEPEFMKQVPDISENDIFTAMEDMSKVNELYDPRYEEYSRNCSNCSAAYELRRRGYDVEAKSINEYYNGSPERLYDYFENAEYIGISGDGSTMTYSEKFVKNRYDLTLFEEIKYKKENEHFYRENTYTPESIEKGIKQHNPPGSRGMIDVYWKDGSGHSIVYEVDTKGDITIRDSQTYDEYSLDELAYQVNCVRITRTDNLQLKEGILNTVKVNEDRKRKIYVDNNRAYNYVE